MNIGFGVDDIHLPEFLGQFLCYLTFLAGKMMNIQATLLEKISYHSCSGHAPKFSHNTFNTFILLVFFLFAKLEKLYQILHLWSCEVCLFNLTSLLLFLVLQALLDYERHNIKGGELNVPIASQPEPMNIENQVVCNLSLISIAWELYIGSIVIRFPEFAYFEFETTYDQNQIERTFGKLERVTFFLINERQTCIYYRLWQGAILLFSYRFSVKIICSC